jgi:hypothetical protein
MPEIPPTTRKSSRKIYWFIGTGLMVTIALIVSALGHQSDSSPPSISSWPSSAASPSNGPREVQRAAPGKHPPRRVPRGPVGESDGVVPDDVTVFDDAFPAVANLDPRLLKALRQAASEAADDGTKFYVNSGWRSPAYQNQLLREAVSKYGSEKEAARWVATAATSLHVKGKAVDIGRPDAAEWLSKQGAEYGLCQIYRNEPWHYELRTNAIAQGCPRMYADPTQDPRTQQ